MDAENAFKVQSCRAAGDTCAAASTHQRPVLLTGMFLLLVQVLQFVLDAGLGSRLINARTESECDAQRVRHAVLHHRRLQLIGRAYAVDECGCSRVSEMHEERSDRALVLTRMENP